jgi:leucyl aminopeptidase
MLSSIRLQRLNPRYKNVLEVILLPAGTNPPTHLTAVFDDTAITPGLNRLAFDTDGRRFCLLGLDSPASTKSLRLAAAKAAKSAPAQGAGRISLNTSFLSSPLEDHDVGRALAEGVSLAMFDTKPYAGAASNRPSRSGMTVHLDTRFHKGFREGLLLGQAVNTARELAATPPNFAGPSQMAERAAALAKTHGMTCRVVDAKAATKLGMGGLLAVGAGSADPPRLVILERNPTGKKTIKPVLLVGKSVTYDSGGYSIKPDGGKGMKADKSGACMLLGVMEALALQKSRVRVVCILAIAENMIDANSYRLDDVITHCNGVTCEITNTDAEGRLILADALAWGTETYKPSTVIDAATLTGGVIVALGRTTTGVFCNDKELMERLNRAALFSDEKVWQLPLDDELREMMRSNIADLQNASSSRIAQAGTGAAYLSYFVGADASSQMPTTPWLHLDIAGTSTSVGDEDWKGLFPKGPTGWGVRTLVRLIADLPAGK